MREMTTASKATRPGSTMGTPAYMPPEQARGRWDEVDARSDLWAVGATMFDLLTGRVVHEAPTQNEQLLAAMTLPAPPLATVLPGTAPVVAHLVDRALAFDREKRWPNARRMLEATRHAYHDRHGQPLSTAPRLTVPETVPNRTLAGAGGPAAAGFLTTNQPLSNSRGAVTGSGAALSRGAVVAVSLGVLTIVALVGAGTFALGSRSRGGSAPPVPATTATAASTSSAAPPPVSNDSPSEAEATPAQAHVPNVSAADLPAAGPTPPKPAPVTPKATAPVSPPPPVPPATTKPNCNPNYTMTVDPATGKPKKIFKPECL
jgi:eukaryotic-like serine/threonine-protein kinase